MNKESILYGIIGLLVGLVITGFVAGQSVNKNHTGIMKMMGIETKNVEQTTANHSTMSMADMNKQLEGLNGDDYIKKLSK